MSAKPITIGSKWIDTKGRTFEVFEKHPFGKVTIKQVDRAYFGTISQKELRTFHAFLP